MQASLALKRQRFPSVLAFLFLLGFLLVGAIAFAPGSNATRQASGPAPPKTSARANAVGSNNTKGGRREFVPGEVLVRFKHNKAFQGSIYLPVPNERPGVQKIAGPSEQVLVNVNRFEGSDLVDGLRLAHTSAHDTWKAIAALKARDEVLYAEPNYIVHADVMPNDTSYDQLWGLKNTGQTVNGVTGIAGDDIDAELAWNITTGSTNIVVGVVDEGIQVSHPDLQANIWTNPAEIPGNGIDDDGNGFIDDVNGYDFVNNSGTIPPEGHGTHIAGTIGAVGNNNQGVVGVNWQTRMMSLRFIDAFIGSGSDADVIRAFAYAKQMHDLWISSSHTQGANVCVLNNSYGESTFVQAVSDGINSLAQSDILFVAAAGNDGTNNDVAPHYPSSYKLPNIVAVTSTNSSDLIGPHNFGAQSVLMGAPGLNIYSTYPPSTYAYLGGTSMAAPHVAGAAALLLAANPNLTVNQLRALLAYNGDVLPSLQGKTVTGRRLNVFKSLQALAENDIIPPGRVGNFLITSQNGRTFNLSWIAAGDDGGGGPAALYDLSFIDQASGAVIPLTTVIPATLGSSQNVSVTIPYRHIAGTIRLREFDNVGNEGTPAQIQIGIDPLVGDPYITSTGNPASLSIGGTPLGLTFDDRYLENYSLPFSFPFFGQNYSTIAISTNGNLYFSTPPHRANGDADDAVSSIGGLVPFKMIAGMWDDLDLRTSRRPDADVYVVQPDVHRIIFRWQGVQFGDGTNGDPINFEIELNDNGLITTRYGSGNINLFPVVGISGGGPDTYVIDSLTSETGPITLTNEKTGLFTPRGGSALPVAQFSLASYSVNEGDGSAVIIVNRTGNTTGTSTVDFATYDGSAIQLRDYLIETGTLTFMPGVTSQSFGVPIVDDVYAESAETLTVALNNPTGAILSPANTATLTINDDDQSGPSVHVNGQLVPPKRFMASLNGAQETPPTCVPPAICPSGSGMVLLNASDTSALVGLQFFNLTSPETAAHIHTQAIGVAGPITFPLAPPIVNPITDLQILPTTPQVADLKAGQQYMNVHSSNFPNGEIRGQLLWNPPLEMPFFIRQHYLDFLNREPDPDGLLYWLSQINCPPPAQGNPPYDQANIPCFHDRTVGVSDAFFFSGEFHLTASFVFLAYRSAYGNTQANPNPDPGIPTESNKLPDYDVFMADRARVLGGAGLTAQQHAFTNLLVRRPEFTSRYGPGLNTGALFVDAVLANIQSSDPGVTFSAATRNTLITEYNNAGGGNAGRAQVIYLLSLDEDNNPNPPCTNTIDNCSFTNAEYNRQFALTLYFGYLRRNPDIGGFLFWQDRINEAPVRDMARQIALVCSFVTSGEYQLRFGPGTASGLGLLFPRTNAECR
jgi:subtilisin family serine protease